MCRFRPASRRVCGGRYTACMKRFMRELRFLIFPVLALLGTSPLALACSCWGTADIGTAMSRAEIVVVGRVERRLEADYSPKSRPSPSGDGIEWSFRIDDAPVAVTVLESLKGDVAGEIRVTTEVMCYRSFDLEDFSPGDTFVFPIYEQTDSELYVLPSCSHSAAKLVNGKLYTNEFVRGGGRELSPYLSLSAVRLLLPLGLLDKQTQYLVGAFVVLLTPILVTHLVRRRTLREPDDSARKINLRSAMAILWMLLCGTLCLALGWLQIWPMTLGIPLASGCALAAAGLAFRWRWSEGFSYGMSLLWICGGAVGTWQTVSEGFQFYESIPKELIIAMAIIGLTFVGMLWYADTVRRRFSPSRGPA